MSRASVNDLLNAVARLSPNDLDDFAVRFADWQREASDDRALIRASQRRLSATDDARLRELVAKSERDRLTEQELAEYRRLAERAERINVHRLQALVELVRRWGKPLRTVMKEIGWESDLHGA